MKIGKLKIKLLAVSLMLAHLMWSCSSEPYEEPKTPVCPKEYTLEVSTKQPVFSYAETTGFIEVSSNAIWEIVKPSGWAMPTKTASGVELSFDANEGEERTYSFLIKTIEGNLSELITITQQKKPDTPKPDPDPDPEKPEFKFSINESEIRTTLSGSIKVISIEANQPWKLISYPENVNVFPKFSEKGTDVQLTINYIGPEPHKGEVIFQSEEKQVEIKIFQSKPYSLGDHWPSEADSKAIVIWVNPEDNTELKVLAKHYFTNTFEVGPYDSQLKEYEGKEQTRWAIMLRNDLIELQGSYKPVGLHHAQIQLVETLGEDWYIPTKEEMEEIDYAYNTIGREEFNRRGQNKNQIENQGYPLWHTTWHTNSSTWIDKYKVYSRQITMGWPASAQSWYEAIHDMKIDTRPFRYFGIKHVEWKKYNQLNRE